MKFLKEFDIYKNKLTSESTKLNYRVARSSKSNKACHYPDFVIFITEIVDIECIYSFAHEVGHAKDFRRGMLDFNRYRKDKLYRIKKEVVAWWYGYRLCKKLEIPITFKFYKHVKFCLASYIR
jgi:hypothetical protein